jgi:beta-lactamase class A
MEDPRDVSARLLGVWAPDPGRSVAARLAVDGTRWEDGAAPHEPRPAASLLKLPLAMAVEIAFASGAVHPRDAVLVGALVGGYVSTGPLRGLDPDLALTAVDVLGLCLSLSDRACTMWLLDAVGLDAVRTAIGDAGCEATTVTADRGHPGGPLVGTTTARDALRLVGAATDADHFPRTVGALRNTIHGSRIPLGADDLDVAIAHKSGSLPGVANDVAILECAGGTAALAFLSEGQHDTLVCGYEMGICARGILEAWGLAVRRSRSLA